MGPSPRSGIWDRGGSDEGDGGTIGKFNLLGCPGVFAVGMSWNFRRLFGISDIYIGFQIFLWDSRSLYGIPDVYLGLQMFIWDSRYLYRISDIYMG